MSMIIKIAMIILLGGGVVYASENGKTCCNDAVKTDWTKDMLLHYLKIHKQILDQKTEGLRSSGEIPEPFVLHQEEDETIERSAAQAAATSSSASLKNKRRQGK